MEEMASRKAQILHHKSPLLAAASSKLGLAHLFVTTVASENRVAVPTWPSGLRSRALRSASSALSAAYNSDLGTVMDFWVRPGKLP